MPQQIAPNYRTIALSSTEEGNVNFIIDGQTAVTITGPILAVYNDEYTVSFQVGQQSYHLNILDTITIDGTPFEGTAIELKEALETILPKVSTPITSELDITGLTTIDISNISKADIVLLRSDNATETVDTITGIPANKKVRFQPEDGLILTLTATDPSTLTDGDYFVGDADVVLDGSAGEFINLENRVIVEEE